MTPKEIKGLLGISPATLKRYRRLGYLKDIKWSAGGGKPYYELEEVKKVFHK